MLPSREQAIQNAINLMPKTFMGPQENLLAALVWAFISVSVASTPPGQQATEGIVRAVIEFLNVPSDESLVALRNAVAVWVALQGEGGAANEPPPPPVTSEVGP